MSLKNLVLMTRAGRKKIQTGRAKIERERYVASAVFSFPHPVAGNEDFLYGTIASILGIWYFVVLQ